MPDIRQTLITQLQTEITQLSADEASLLASIDSLRADIVSRLQASISMMKLEVSSLQADLVTNPVPASPTPVTPPPPVVPTLTATAMTAANWVDTYNMANNGGSVVYDANGVTYAPPAQSGPTNTSAVMLLHKPTVTTPTKDFEAKMVFNTLKQLRIGSPPHDWECFWFVFNYQIASNGKKTANYLTCKPSGIDVGKMWNELGQAFIGAETAYKCPIGSVETLDVIKKGQSLAVSLNGVQAFQKTFTGGAVGGTPDGFPQYQVGSMFDQPGCFCLYNEDSKVNVLSFAWMPL